MKSKIQDWWIQVRASYWFVPSLMSAASTILAVLVVRWDMHVGDDWLQQIPWLYASQPAGARALLSTVAGSMITVAGVTFSMTLLAVSHASAQIGPRLLSGFMRDRGNQWTLGTFIATFLYCLMVLRTVQTGGDGDGGMAVFVPNTAILVALGMAVLSVMVLIYFIHHVPQSINVSSVVARVGDEVVAGIQAMYPSRLGTDESADATDEDIPAGFAEDAVALRVEEQCGYLRVLDTDGIMAVATHYDLIADLVLHPGNFAIPGQTLMRVWPAERVDDEVRQKLAALYSWGVERTGEQDVLFPIEQLTEVLGKAMSPGVNGQYTALLCLNQFERALGELLARGTPDPLRYDAKGKLRVIAKPVSQRDIVLGIVRPVRQFVRGDWLTTDHLLRMFERLSAIPRLADHKRLLAEAAALIRDDVAQSSMSEAEKRALLEGQPVASGHGGD